MSSIHIKIRFLNLLMASLIFLLLGTGCHHSTSERSDNHTLFHLLSSQHTGITFSNNLTEGINTNVLLYQYFYNGGGVAVGDFNGDGLEDLYFTGNMTDNKLYVNQGGMHFSDITTIAGVAGRPGPWKTGATIVDINGDGKLDIFVCYSGHLRPEKRVQQLYVNKGNDASGIPHFEEMAAKYGLDFASYATQAYFFDYDRDGDLDLLLVNHNPERLNVADVTDVSLMMKTKDNESGIRLLENAKGRFMDVTSRSGIKNTTLSYGLAAGISDINGDGLPDIYLSNDYNVPDRLYINKGNGLFEDQLKQQIGHTSFYSMGNDVADINNDLKPDIYTLDMLPEDNHRQKLLFGADNYEAFELNLNSGFHYQYMRNMLQLNNGNGTFSEVGQQMNVSNTDWSWAPLIADYDNDGWKDIFVSNGYTRDYTNMDFLKFAGDQLLNRKVVKEDLLKLVKQMPYSSIKSYFFRNDTKAGFSNVSKDWGINTPANSNGAAYADLNNDGTLEIIVNNVNQPPFIYENHSGTINKNHYLSIVLRGSGLNTQGIGAKLFVYHAGMQQYLEQMPTRGYQSSVTSVLHVGTGRSKLVDSIKIEWPGGGMQVIKNINADRRIVLKETDAKDINPVHEVLKPIFEQMPSPINISYTGRWFNDYKRQPLLINPLSYSGPCMAKGDLNGDQLEDIYVGADQGKAGAIYLQKPDQQFALQEQPALKASAGGTDASAVFFDANGDGLTDLYVASGGYEDYTLDDPLLQDRLYLNNGRGKLVLAVKALPQILGSKSCVKVADINGDGHMDIFVGGRLVAGRYPETPQSYLLINDGKGNFSDQTTKYSKSLRHIGMVTDAAFTDMNGDGKPDLVIVGDWMPVTVLLNSGTKLTDATAKYLKKQYRGWWNVLTTGDFNHDGHPDFFIGNLGTNSQCKASDQEPAELYFKDFDENGAVDPILCFYIQHKSYPCVTRDELLDQISKMRSRYPDYKSYADATVEEIFSPEDLKSAGHLTANCLETSLFLSKGNGQLERAPLPQQSQYAPIFTITPVHLTNDANTSMLLGGNIMRERIHFGRYDAGYGVLLKASKDGTFRYIDQQTSGLTIKGDIRSALTIGHELLFGVNGRGIIAYKKTIR